MKGNIYSQTGSLLTSLRLYNEAIENYKQSLRIDSILNDSVNMIYDCEILSHALTQSNLYDQAKTTLKRVRPLACTTLPADTLVIDMYLAELFMKMGKPDSAAFYIDNIPEKIDADYSSSALALAIKINLQKGNLDKAAKYARQLLATPDSLNKQTAYSMLLNPALQSSSPVDSLRKYIEEYRKVIENTISRQQSQQALMQQSQYNYSIHQLKAAQAISYTQRLWIWLLISFIIILSLLVFLLYLRIRQTRQIMRLNAAISSLSINRHQPSSLSENVPEAISETRDDDSVAQLRTRLYERINRGISKEIPTEFLTNDTYGELRLHLKENGYLAETHHLWNKLEQMVESVQCDFRKNLLLLTNGNLTDAEYHTALLVKCGVTPTEMSVLLGKSKGTISSRRINLGKKIFDSTQKVSVVDDLIRAL